MIQTVKNLLKKAEGAGEDPYIALLNYRATPVYSKLQAPAKLLNQRTTGHFCHQVDACNDWKQTMMTYCTYKDAKRHNVSNMDKGPGRTSVKSCLFNKKICHHLGFARATDLSDIFKNERNAPNVQRYRHLKLPSSGPRQNATKYQKSF